METPSTVVMELTEIPLPIGTAGMMLSHLLSWIWTNCKDEIDCITKVSVSTIIIQVCALG